MSGKSAYTYQCISDGYVVINGRRFFNRPLYGSHAIRDEGKARFLTLAGDRPQFLGLITDWRKDPSCSQAKCGTLLLGVCQHFEKTKQSKPGNETSQCSKWLHDFTHTETCYRAGGSIHYQANDHCLPRVRIEMDAVRLVNEEGWIVRVRIAGVLQPFDLVLAFGGITDKCGNLDYQNEQACAFKPSDCRQNKYEADGRWLRVSFKRKSGREYMFVSSGMKGEWHIGDADKVAEGPFAVANSRKGPLPLAVFTSLIAKGGSSEYILCCRGKAPPVWMRNQQADFEKHFTACIRHYDVLSQQVRVATPDHHINLGVRSQCLAMDACWHKPTYHHGPWAWHAPFLGWRNWYGPTVAGWHDHVREAIRAHAATQIKAPEAQHRFEFYEKPAYPKGPRTRGALPALLHRKDIAYNMGEVYVDHILHHLDWTGDIELAREMFPVIRNKLDWEEKWLGRGRYGLYENFINTWISDAHAYNGGGCIQASAYNYRANKRMYKIAGMIGKEAAIFKRRYESIFKACRDKLWVSEKGVFAEYIDTMGNKLRHESPELASIYHPIECGLADEFMAYQMLRFSETRLRNEYSTPRGGRLVWSSAWLPPLYSSCGLYPQENIHLLWCYYRLGLVEKAEQLMNGIIASLYQGPSPGSLCHNISPTGEQKGSTDFSDTVSMFLRTIVEGLFGIEYRLLEGKLIIKPCFPEKWNYARIQTPDITLGYTFSNLLERIKVKSARPCSKTLRIPARKGRITKVTVDGKACRHRLEAGITSCYVVVEIPDVTEEDEVRIGYAETPLPEVSYDPEVREGEMVRVAVKNGAVAGVFDPQRVLRGVARNKSGVSGHVEDRCDFHTFFVKTANREMGIWRPVDVRIKRPETARGRAPCPGSISESSPCLVSLEKFYNADILKIHKNRYPEPRPKTYSLMTSFNGRFLWDWNARGYKKVKINTCRLRRLTDKNGIYKSSVGIPFRLVSGKPDVVAVSVWKNFPEFIDIPVGKKGKELYIFFFGVTNPMQSRVENGRITLFYNDGEKKRLSLINPDNFDDWLCDPYHLHGETEYLGDKTHGIILNIPLKDKFIDKIEMRATANEVIIGLLGLTIIV